MIKAGLKNPKLIVNRVFRKRYKWSKEKFDDKIKKREYKTYSDYLKHQKSKLENIRDSVLPDYDISHWALLINRIRM